MTAACAAPSGRAVRAAGAAAAGGTDPVICGLQGGRLSPKILASIVRWNAERAGIEKRVTAHTSGKAPRLDPQSEGRRTLVAEFLEHANLSTVARHAHVAPAHLLAAEAQRGPRRRARRGQSPR